MTETLRGQAPWLVAAWITLSRASDGDVDAWARTIGSSEDEVIRGQPRVTCFRAVDESGSELDSAPRLAFFECQDSETAREVEAWLDTAETPAGLDVSERISYRGRSSLATGGSVSFSAYPILLCVQAFIFPHGVDAFREWLDAEHAVRQVAVGGVHFYQGFESVEGDFHFLNLWALDAPSVTVGDEWVHARESAWRTQVLQAGNRFVRQFYRLETLPIPADQLTRGEGR